jgi:2-polyprenyl-3-methyl-5-hydroxy-6-metoxy-1,4-benzoquinol methylase
MPSLAFSAQRVLNGMRKVGAGLRPFGESVFPGVPNDLFVAHASIYHFASRFVAGARVLDAGCGTGYGARILSRNGAAHVHGIDIDPLSVAYARRRYASSTVSFARADCESLVLPEGHFDFVFASNVLEHLERPELLLRSAIRALRPGGRALFAVPPITSEETAALHHGIHYHRSNLTVAAWYALLSALPWSLGVYGHSFVGPGRHPDFASPFRSCLVPSAFAFTESTAADLHDAAVLTAVFLAVKPES